ncbi:unnamed protein product [Dibothriocephalus latus]|uniref:Calx-beta domain-containing protein n=1 Tax=Dibothriocephalus latus TaxID=60516 RepID=A0A3P7LI10_DIBLA|nr:unnamed protein product [Dibothriocephalus latus]
MPFKPLTAWNTLVILLLGYGASAMELVDGMCPSLKQIECKPGLLLPVWKPVNATFIGDKAARSIVYFLALLYCFLGVSIIADRFMAAIEVITSKEKEIVIKTKSGEKQTISVRIWNETVSNLTLMALGSSAPEILLSIIEICGKNFEAGDLGPGTIVGSAAFNMFVIIGVCIIVIPKGSVRRIKHLSVFFVTSTWSIFAYLWLYFIIAISSPDEVVVWEALLTFIFFPVTVLTAYIADRKLVQKRFLRKRYSARKTVKSLTEEDIELNGKLPTLTLSDEDSEDPKDAFERTRLEYVEVMRNIRKEHPNIDTKELEELAQIEVLNKGPKSRALYRMQATRALTGGGSVITKAKVERRMSIQTVEVKEIYGPETQQVFFSPGHYTVMENVGTFGVTVFRKGGDMDATISVDYFTEDGTAVANEDYVPASGTLVFNANETHKQISIAIIDDEVFEEDEHFSIRLNNLKVVRSTKPIDLRLVDPSVATVLVLDDDHCGVFQFKSDSVQISESCGVAEIPVARNSGARGSVRVPYKTLEGTAKGNGKDYEDASGYIEFQNDQTEAIIRVAIVDDNDYEKNEFFYIQLEEPILMSKDGALSKSLNSYKRPLSFSLFIHFLGTIVISENAKLKRNFSSIDLNSKYKH